MTKSKPSPANGAGFERSLISALAMLCGAAWLLGERSSGLQLQVTGQISVSNSSGWVVLLLMILVMVVNGLLVASEAAVSALSAVYVKHEQRAAESKRLQDLVENQGRYVSACRFGSQLSRLCMTFIGFMLAPDVAIWLEKWLGWSATNYSTIVAGAIAVAAIVVPVNLVAAELAPKSYAAIHPGASGLRLFGFIRLISMLLSIPASIELGLARMVAARFGARGNSPANIAEEQIKTLADTAQESGQIETDEREMLHSVFEFTDTVAREVMTPRVDLDAMPVTVTAEELVTVIESTGHSRIPIYEETDDQIIGVVHAKDLLLALVEKKDPIDLRSLIRPVLFVPENKGLTELLAEMRQSRTQMAVVQDEFGGTAGIVTTEDIVEELVGDIVDEYDVEETSIVRTGDGYLVDGRTHVDDVNSEIGSDFPSDEFDTIGGFVFGLFGRQPKQGESVESEGYCFDVAETDGRRILKLNIERMRDTVTGGTE